MSNLSLAGDWQCILDPDDNLLADQTLSAEAMLMPCRLPGTLCLNGIGAPLETNLELTKESIRALRSRFQYIGAAWYVKQVHLPSEWSGKRIELFLERVIFESRVWVDGVEVGAADSLSAPHTYDLTQYVQAGSSHELRIRIDNRDVQRIGAYPSAYTDETQTIWNGIVGLIELRARELVTIEDLQVYPNAAEKSARVRLTVANRSGAAIQTTIAINCLSDNTFARHELVPVKHELMINTGQEEFEWELFFGEDALLWDEFNPALYTMRVSIEAMSNHEACVAVFRYIKEVSIGLRDFSTSGTQFTINGRPVFLRGTLDCCVFPLTGHPPMEVEEWERIFQTAKAYGLNHIRFHSWCPPEAAFMVADRIGLYLLAETPVWMDTWNTPVGTHPEHYTYLPAEAERILRTYANHPSFCMFSVGNEIRGDFELLHSIIEGCKQQDRRVLYTLTSNWDRPLDPADDFFIAQTVDGVGGRGQYFLDAMAEATELDYSSAVALRPVPVITHEVGQYTVYPNMAEIERYQGALRPLNFESIRYDLEQKGMLELAPQFTQSSGKLALQLYRDEIEASLRTKGLGGFQLLGLQDFPGQSTATIGILDSFWESKGLIEPDQFRRFCSPSVLLMRMKKRIYEAHERFSATVEAAHFGAAPLSDATVIWNVQDASGATVGSGSFLSVELPVGNGTVIGTIPDLLLHQVTKPSRLTITVAIAGQGIENAWDIWVYPQIDMEDLGNNVYVTDTWDAELESCLNQGGRVLYFPQPGDPAETLEGRFFPVFWSPVHFASPDPCGICCQADHPVFQDFPTSFHADYQWKDLLEHSFSVDYTRFAEQLKPLVQVVPNFFNNRRWTNLFEVRVGEGKLLVCTLQLLADSAKRPAARALLDSLLDYMKGESFQPADRLEAGALRAWLATGAAQSTSTKGSLFDLAYQQCATADSEWTEDRSAVHGNNGDLDTCWQAADEAVGHWWQVDLGRKADITGTRVVFVDQGNFHYLIQTSDDGQNWQVAANRTGHTAVLSEERDRFSTRARYVRIVYNSLPEGKKAGHRMFQVF